MTGLTSKNGNSLKAFLEVCLKKENLSFVGKVDSPFNREKYQKLLEGLEAVELKLSEVLVDNEDFKINSEFFRKKIYKNN